MVESGLFCLLLSYTVLHRITRKIVKSVKKNIATACELVFFFVKEALPSVFSLRPVSLDVHFKRY